MTITIQYRGQLAELTGTGSEALDDKVRTVRDILKHIKKSHGSKAEQLAKAMLIAIDGESILLRKGYATQLKDDETVQFFPICGGGQYSPDLQNDTQKRTG